MKQKIIILVLVLVVAISSMFTGCSGKDSSSGNSLPRSTSGNSSSSDGNGDAGENSASESNGDAAGNTAADGSSGTDSAAGGFGGLPSGNAGSLASGDAGVDVDITEKMYVAYINEIYVNTPDYIGQNIRIQGMFQAYTDETTGLTYYYVYRVGPGCCGNDGSMCGFEFTWNGDLPKDNDWIEVIGSLRTYEDDGWSYLTLDASSVTVMKERGAENVLQ
ncbi:hypothetical protein FRZ06_11280 [Anoxybacterium hadale]|uniref:Uncharacterized protein n=1 Tax=Anoxybacterium hadale TaxID=3408580 RepID=A0ACD1AC88_9FIRM|nr:hypothetical protein FRZ06_11280 [Clostridiales bacterium]